ncbi:MAG: DUF3034 family protein [Candidatus Aureabacteria bacterium]|nr:DUF3034 family protein [Candidatus Auribacterota bacterium]
MKLVAFIIVVAYAFAIGNALAQTQTKNETGNTLASPDTAEASVNEAPPKPQKAPPLPFHTIEGYGGGSITPMAYLVNQGPEGTIFGLPSGAYSQVFMPNGKKDLEAWTFTETLFRRLELGYGLDRLGLGTLPQDISDATDVGIGRHHVLLHNFNARALLLEENSFKLPVPALTFGTHFKYNDGIQQIDHALGGALKDIGLEKSNGVDFTLTSTKTFMLPVINRPLIVTAGMRGSSAAQIGFLGYGDKWRPSFEGNVAFLPTDWLLVAYELRQKKSPYSKIPGLIEEEDPWNAIDVSWIINSHMTLVGGWGAFGKVTNKRENGTWFLQLKYEI